MFAMRLRGLSPVLLAALAPLPILAQDLRLHDRGGFATATTSRSGDLYALDQLGHTLLHTSFGWRELPVARRDGSVPLPQLVGNPGGHGLWCLGVDQSLQMRMHRCDGNAWYVYVPPQLPPPRNHFVLAADTTRREVVLFGGRSLFWQFLNDTWVFDGVTWQQRQPNTSPPGRSDAAHAFDDSRGRLVVYGGQSSGGIADTWEWDGTDWLLRQANSPPGLRWYASMAYDAQRSRCVLFGGLSASPGDETYEWDGQNWTLRPTATRPTPRLSAALAYDGRLGEVVLAGSNDVRPELDTWSWNGVRWQARDLGEQPRDRQDSTAFRSPLGDLCLYEGTRQPVATQRWDGRQWLPVPGLQPPARYRAAVATGPSHTFLYGGVSDVGVVRNDLWRFDGAVWQALPPGPGGRYGAQLAFDPLRNELLLFGGNPGGSLSDETWVFDGGTWQPRSPAVRPPVRAFASMGFDPVRGTILMYGGLDPNSQPRQDTWAWDGNAWTMLHGQGPAFGNQPSLAFDAGTNRNLLVGSDTNGTSLLAYVLAPTGWLPVTFGDVALPGGAAGHLTAVGIGSRPGFWVLNTLQLFTLGDEQATAQPLGIPCSATAPHLHANGWPRLGDGAFALELHGQPGGGAHAVLTGFPGAATPLLGCTLHVASAVASFVATDATGRATLALPIPLANAFLGLQLVSQVAALDPGSPAGVGLSEGLLLGLGR